MLEQSAEEKCNAQRHILCRNAIAMLCIGCTLFSFTTLTHTFCYCALAFEGLGCHAVDDGRDGARRVLVQQPVGGDSDERRLY